jgi:hypothetical protein
MQTASKRINTGSKPKEYFSLELDFSSTSLLETGPSVGKARNLVKVAQVN